MVLVLVVWTKVLQGNLPPKDVGPISTSPGLSSSPATRCIRPTILTARPSPAARRVLTPAVGAKKKRGNN